MFQQDVQSVSAHEKMMSDPSMMTNLMKKQLTGTAPHLVMGFLVNQFFAGFVMGKVPFTLSPRFRAMLQRGIDMASLDVSYFTSLSFYVLLLFGLKGILSLIFSGDTIDESAVMQQSMAGMSGPAAFDVKTEFAGEKTKWELVRIQCLFTLAIQHRRFDRKHLKTVHVSSECSAKYSCPQNSIKILSSSVVLAEISVRSP